MSSDTITIKLTIQEIILEKVMPTEKFSENENSGQRCRWLYLNTHP
jgi:hypothetical protein